ncbi:macoilin-like isoform X2 [Haemaphysalis longicornis]
MKRRNAECGKIRRPGKRAKITEGIYGSTFVYIKFLLLWALLLLADFILELRFEFLWPFWLLLRSVYDSFKYQGLAFSVFFVFIALTSDMICFLFLPVHVLFFVASTYVWGQYVWHTAPLGLAKINPPSHLPLHALLTPERGICLPTLSLWLFFMYIEATVRLKDIKNTAFHLDLCRPFAAHCIGYPMVTMSFCVKSYIGYRMRLRKQKEVAKENDFYIQLLQQALPPEPPSITSSSSDKSLCKLGEESPPPPSNGFLGSRKARYAEADVKNHLAALMDKHEFECHTNEENGRATSVNDFDAATDEVRDKTAFKVNGVCGHNGGSGLLTPAVTSSSSSRSSKWAQQQSAREATSSAVSGGGGGSSRRAGKNNCTTTNNNLSGTSSLTAATPLAVVAHHPRDDHYQRLEADVKRLKTDLQASRQTEQELRSQLHSLSAGERSVKSELLQLQQDNENLQNKLHNLVTARQQDKCNVSQLEKRLQEERKLRGVLETQLSQERKAKKAEEAAAARAALAMATARSECTESCKARRRDLENDVRQLRRDLKVREEQLRAMEREAQSLRQYKDSIGDTEILMSALSAMQDKNAHLENSLSAETRLKMDLFSALGEAKRQQEICQAMLTHKEKEVDDLKTKIAEVMAVMPATSTYPAVAPPALDSELVSSLLYSPKFITGPPPATAEEKKLPKSNLDPNASVYTPKMVPSDH